MRPLRLGIAEAWRSIRRRLSGIPAPGDVDFGTLRRLSPISREFGTDRGSALDRYYIEQFLDQNKQHVRGKVLEVGEDTYTRRFGDGRIQSSDILHVNPSNPMATIVADLAHAPQIPEESFDAIVLTQTLHLIYEPREALQPTLASQTRANSHRI